MIGVGSLKKLPISSQTSQNRKVILLLIPVSENKTLKKSRKKWINSLETYNLSKLNQGNINKFK